MARLNTLSDGDTTEFKRLLGEHVTAEDARKLMKYPSVVAAMARTMREHPTFRLMHGRFDTLAAKIAMVQKWPGISERFTEADFTRAVEEARDTGRLQRFGANSPKMPLLDIVVVPYLETVAETFFYGRDRLRDAHGEKFAVDANETTFDGETFDLGKRLALLEGIQPVTKRIKIEIVDLGANWSKGARTIPRDIRSTKSAHAQVLFAGAQDPDWARQLDPRQGVPCVLFGGYALMTADGRDDSTRMLALWRALRDHKVGLTIGCKGSLDGPTFDHALPVVWE